MGVIWFKGNRTELCLHYTKLVLVSWLLDVQPCVVHFPCSHVWIRGTLLSAVLKEFVLKSFLHRVCVLCSRWAVQAPLLGWLVCTPMAFISASEFIKGLAFLLLLLSVNMWWWIYLQLLPFCLLVLCDAKLCVYEWQGMCALKCLCYVKSQECGF